MDVEAVTDDLQSKVLRHTLAEVAARGELTDDARLSEPCCVICLDTITEPCEARPCKHRNFDYVCLLTWLGRVSTCPLCKSAILEVAYDFDHDGTGTSRTYLVSQGTAATAQHRQDQAQPSRPQRPPERRQNRHRHESIRHQPAAQDPAIVRRQQIYRYRLYSLHVGSNSRSHYREITPALFESEPELVSRARSWLRRELKVFAFLRTPSSPQASDDAMTRRRANNAEFLLEYIIAILKTVDIKGSQGAAEDMLSEFLGRDNTMLLLHELRSFLRSPFSLGEWDRNVQYPSPDRLPIPCADQNAGQRGRLPGSGTMRSRSRTQQGQGLRGADLYRPFTTRNSCEPHSRIPPPKSNK
ncbi:hypothetical protein F4808DRAFT_1278 [Astrocystis sublimbata]|nr:hypothetical protein F4808DRAFT_1278 [Astrocystis sublimbata]